MGWEDGAQDVLTSSSLEVAALIHIRTAARCDMSMISFDNIQNEIMKKRRKEKAEEPSESD